MGGTLGGQEAAAKGTHACPPAGRSPADLQLPAPGGSWCCVSLWFFTSWPRVSARTIRVALAGDGVSSSVLTWSLILLPRKLPLRVRDRPVTAQQRAAAKGLFVSPRGLWASARRQPRQRRPRRARRHQHDTHGFLSVRGQLHKTLAACESRGEAGRLRRGRGREESPRGAGRGDV